MRRLFVVLLSALLLCGCAPLEQNNINKEGVIETRSFVEVIDSRETEILNTSDASGTLPRKETNMNIDVIDGEGMIPLLFIETEIYKDRAYVLGAGKDGVFYYADQFKYNGKSLYNENIYDGRMMLENEPAESPIMEEQCILQFQNPYGECFTTTHQGLTTDGEASVEYIYVFTQLPKNTVQADGLYLGSYEEANMFPQHAEYSKQCVVCDLDGNGVRDTIMWELFENRLFEFAPLNYSDYLYDYQVTIEQNGTVYTIENDRGQTVLKHGMAVFVADVDQNGDFEVIIYERDGLNPRVIMIYDFDGTTFVERKVCPIVIMN